MDAERAMLADALELEDPASLAFVSREPLGDGSVAGFALDDLVYYVDTSRRKVARETGMLAGTPDEPEARIWLHPADPHLPVLAAAAFSDAAATLLDRLGMPEGGMPQMVAYRPGRRAVLRVPLADGGEAWVKAVPTSRVETIVRAHAVLADAGVPVPTVRGWSPDGLIVWDAARGIRAQDAPWTPEGLLDEVDALRTAFARAALAGPARVHLDRRLDWYAARLDDVLPEPERRAAAAVAGRARAGWGAEHPVVVHGDLHFGQLFLDDDLRLSGVIDVDTAGVGEASDDTAAFVSHAIASALLTPAPQDERVRALARAAVDRWDAALRPRAAAHLLGHTLGAWEVGDRERATTLLEAAETVSRADGET